MQLLMAGKLFRGGLRRKPGHANRCVLQLFVARGDLQRDWLHKKIKIPSHHRVPDDLASRSKHGRNKILVVLGEHMKKTAVFRQI